MFYGCKEVFLSFLFTKIFKKSIKVVTINFTYIATPTVTTTQQHIQLAQSPQTPIASKEASQPPPQRVQIMRTPDGRITVKGLLPGQQLVQYPDGKLQVLTSQQVQREGLVQATPQKVVKPPVQQVAASVAGGKWDNFFFFFLVLV